MTNLITQKSPKCIIEWAVETPNRPDTLVSETFLFLCYECHLQLTLGIHYTVNPNVYDPSHLYFNYHGELKAPINVSVRVVTRSGILNAQQQQTIKSISATNTSIWSTSNGEILRNVLLTFEVMVYDDPLTGSQTDAIAACNASEENSKSSKSRMNIHLEALSRDFSKLLDGSSSFDVEITCEGKTFKSHRIVLETRSSVFSAMLKSDMVEGKTGLIKVEDITASIFESFLRYFYSGTFPELSVDTAKQFYETSDKYAVDELKTTCSEFLTKNLSVDNACEVLVLADQHSDENFRNDVITYIVEKKIPQRDKQWTNFCKKHPILAIEVQNVYIQKHCPE